MRGPVIVFAVAFAVIGVIAASSVYVTERNESSMKLRAYNPPQSWSVIDGSQCVCGVVTKQR